MAPTHKIIVFTDLHITVDPHPDNPDPADSLRAGLAHAMATNPDAAMILLTGDLTHHGDAASYRRLKPLLEGAPVPVVFMLGNHDDRGAFRDVFPDVPVDEDGFVQRVVTLGDYRLITLDTLVVPREGVAHTHAGELCARRMAWLDLALAEAGDMPCIVALHHPPNPTGFASMDRIRLRAGEAFHDLIARHGNVRHLICGHIHRTISGTHRGTPYSIFKSPVGQMPLNFEGLDTSVECDDPPAFGIVIAHEAGVMVHTEDYAVP